MPLLSNPAAANNPNGFGIVTYNVLAKSLGTSMIPWVMTVSPLIQKRILKHNQQESSSSPSSSSNTSISSSSTTTTYSFDGWVNDNLKPEYMKHFHKNFDSGNYAKMREFWGYPKPLTSTIDIPKELNAKLTFVNEDCVSYGYYDYDHSTNDDTTTKSVTARTLRGVAKEVLSSDDDPTLFEDFFQDVIGREERVFSWHVRGPRIFQTIFSSKQHEQHEQQEYSTDIIALQEYDFHDVVANYRGIGNNDKNNDETFAEAMAAMDYDGAFFKDPLQGRDPPSGLGVFWNKHVFETITKVEGIQVLECQSGNSIDNIDDDNNDKNDMDGFQGAVTNYDLQEMWHPINKTQQQQSQQLNESVIMKAADRRNVGFCRLRHKATGKIVTVCATHLMTTSRDGSKTNLYPGEVRAGEIARIREIMEQQEKLKGVGEDDDDSALLFVGDLNTDAKDAKTIFGGNIVASSSSSATSNNKDDNDDSSTTPTPQNMVSFDTGFDTATSSFQWGTRSMVEAFEQQHQWGKETENDNNNNINNKNKKKYCSSRNAARIEWIDYVFYDQNKLKCCHVKESLTPSTQIPNEIHPSDHLPLFASFEFK